MKKIIVLGGTYFQIPVIKYAKSRGIFVITCDYLPDNPGHKISDKYYNLSTTDKDAILDMAIKENVVGVIAFASDPAAPTAAYVNEKLGVWGTSYDSVLVLSEKDLWREFLLKNKFNTPKAYSFSHSNDLEKLHFNYPVMIKPTDSSGSKGVRKVRSQQELQIAIDYAKQFSRNNRLIIEEYVNKVGCQIGGDAYIGNNEIDFICLGDQQVDNKVNAYVPCGMIFPSSCSDEIKNKIVDEINRLAKLLDLKNLIINIEVMIDSNQDIYLMEIGPRSGGNFIHKAIYELMNIDLAMIAIESLFVNESVGYLKKTNKSKSYTCYYALHSETAGKITDLSIVKKELLVEDILFNAIGDEVSIFNGSNSTVGILIYKSKDKENIKEVFSFPSMVICD